MMNGNNYGYQEDEIINSDFILRNYNQEDIFCIIFGEQMYDNKYICSPFRDDKNPACYFEMYNDILWFIDFADKNKIRRNCFDIIMDKFNCNFHESCIFIHNYFQNNDNIKNNININSSNKRIVNKTKSDFNIILKTRYYKIKDKNYWNQFEITKEQLLEDNVFPVIWFKTQGFKPNDFLIRPDTISYAIKNFQDDKRVKIYLPLEVNKKKKWFTNCKSDDIGNFNKISITGKNLIITKSYKDCRIIRNQNIDSVWFQNETTIPNIEILYDLFLRFENTYTLFDNDKQGISMSNIIKNIAQTEFQIGVNNLFIPEMIGKDSADFIKKDKKQFKQFLIKNLLL